MRKTPTCCPTEQDPRWAAVLARDARADGAFVYAVKTTGVYCHPGSPARLPKPENVEFFATEEAARAAGYRPSRRYAAKPAALTSQHADTIAQACRHIETSTVTPTLKALAAMAGLSPFHFHRLFKQTTGLTPGGYARAQRANRMRKNLATGQSVTNALYDAGFNSNSRFYETSERLLGMTPTSYRRGGLNTDIRFAIGQCTLGAILVAQSERGICAISLGEDPDRLARQLQDQFPNARLVGDDAAFAKLIAHVVGFVEAPAIGLDLPLDVQGTAFQERVWQALRDIEPGETVSYTDLARRIGAPKAVRAVASACAANTLAVAIPCHRVVRHDGALAGYRWGVERKRALLEREAQQKNSPDT